ncbi:MAG: ribosome biogenesis GTP-binding protein YihA/YsxC [Acidimicrobiales bacterium]
MAPLPLEFVTSADRVEKLPASAAEVTVVGRSNVGKSSLLNALAHRKKLAHVSNTPGRTRLLNLFSIGELGTMVDLPGYGFAKAPANMRGGWQRMIEGYLLDRPNLRMVMVLVDGAVGPTKLDVQMLEWLRAEGLPHTVIATKHDKVKASKRDKRKKEVAEGCDLEVGDVIWVSAEKGTGIDRLRGLVLRWLE